MPAGKSLMSQGDPGVDRITYSQSQHNIFYDLPSNTGCFR